MLKILGLKAPNGTSITDLDSNFDSQWYNIGENIHPSFQLVWDADVEGTFYLDLSNQSADNGALDDPTFFSTKNVVAIISTDRDLLILDSNLGTVSFRIRWENTSGTANLLSSTVAKGYQT